MGGESGEVSRMTAFISVCFLVGMCYIAWVWIFDNDFKKARKRNTRGVKNAKTIKNVGVGHKNKRK